MQVVLDDNNSIYVQDDSPNAETHYWARFYPPTSLRTGFDPNSIAMARNDAHYIFYANQKIPLGPTPYTLTTLVDPTSAGTISVNPDPNCPENKYADGTVINLNALQNPNYVFSYWSGDATGTSSNTNLTINSNKVVAGYFDSVIFTNSFETGPTAPWGRTSATTDSGDLSVTTAAAIVGAKGLQAVLGNMAVGWGSEAVVKFATFSRGKRG